jgi:hypothetical protein
MELRIQLLAIAASGLLLLIVLELVRRKAFLERYALLWLFSALVLLGLSIWQGFLEELASAIGIAYPPNALFLVAFGFVLILLLHFSLAVSRLSDQSKVLAQRLALLEQRQQEAEERRRDTEERWREPEDDGVGEREIAGRPGRISRRRHVGR